MSSYYIYQCSGLTDAKIVTKTSSLDHANQCCDSNSIEGEGAPLNLATLPADKVKMLEELLKDDDCTIMPEKWFHNG